MDLKVEWYHYYRIALASTFDVALPGTLYVPSYFVTLLVTLTRVEYRAYYSCS